MYKKLSTKLCENLIGIDTFSTNSIAIEQIDKIFTDPQLCKAIDYHVMPITKELFQVYLTSLCILRTNLNFDGQKLSIDVLDVTCIADAYNDVKINWNL